MKKQDLYRCTLLVSLVALSGCAALDSEMPLIVTAGSSICTAPSMAECEAMQRIADSLNTGPLAKAIEDARLK